LTHSPEHCSTLRTPFHDGPCCPSIADVQSILGGNLTPPLNLLSRLVTQHFLRNHIVQDTIALGTMHRVRFAQGWPWWFEQHFDIRVCGVKLREHFPGFLDGNFSFFQKCPQRLSWCLADMSPQHDGTVLPYEIAWGLDIGKPRCPHPCDNVCYQIHFSNFAHNATWENRHMYVGYQIHPFLDVSHNATWGNHHMYVGYQIHFSNLFHNATWGNHHMYVGYQIHFSNLSHNATCITCMLVTKSISRFFFIMQPGEPSHVCWLPNPFPEESSCQTRAEVATHGESNTARTTVTDTTGHGTDNC